MGRPLGKIRVMVSSSALFDMREEDALWKKDQAEYIQYMHKNQDVPLKPGACFELVQSMYEANKKVGYPLFEILIVTKNAISSSGLRTEKTILNYGFPQESVFFYNGSPVPMGDHEAFETDLFLTTCKIDAQNAVDANIAAAIMEPRSGDYGVHSKLKFWFDFDAVVAGSSSELVYKEQGLAPYKKFEADNGNTPLENGPFENLLKKLTIVSKELKAQGHRDVMELGILTARGGTARLRAMRTMEDRGIEVDVARLLSGADKHPWIATNKPSIFFDDQRVHLESSCAYTPCGHVLYPTGSPMFEYMRAQEAKAANDNKTDATPAPTAIATPKPS